MRIADVIGTVTLSRAHPSFAQATLKLVAPLSLDELASDKRSQADALVCWDQLGAGIGSRVALSEGAEAAQPFRPDFKPVDAYAAAILDAIDLSAAEIQDIRP